MKTLSPNRKALALALLPLLLTACGGGGGDEHTAYAQHKHSNG